MPFVVLSSVLATSDCLHHLRSGGSTNHAGCEHFLLLPCYRTHTEAYAPFTVAPDGTQRASQAPWRARPGLTVGHGPWLLDALAKLAGYPRRPLTCGP